MISRDAHEEEARFHATLMKRKLQNCVSNGYHSLKVTEASQEPLGDGTISHDAHEEKAHFHMTVVSNGYHSLRVTEALQELLGEGTFSSKAREALAINIIQSELQKLSQEPPGDSMISREMTWAFMLLSYRILLLDNLAFAPL